MTKIEWARRLFLTEIGRSTVLGSITLPRVRSPVFVISQTISDTWKLYIIKNENEILYHDQICWEYLVTKEGFR